MKRIVRAGGRQTRLYLELAGGALRALLLKDGAEARSFEWQVTEIEPGLYSILHGFRSIEARVSRNHTHWIVEVGGNVMELEVEDPRELRQGGRQLAREGRVSMVSPMPGKVVRVLVAEGDEVAEGQGLVVVEAMKMQNEMKAPRSGCVTSVGVKEGASVNAGQVLVTLE
jgi:acetyl/propionyl-CoA carboxylase alpha subunit